MASSATPSDRAAGNGRFASAPPDGRDESPPKRRGHWWSAPLRWLRRTAAAVLRPLRALTRSPWRLAKTVFMATLGRDRGFGFWWLVATLALAAVVGLILAIVLSPVLGLVAALVVGIWMLVRGRRESPDGSGADESTPAGAHG